MAGCGWEKYGLYYQASPKYLSLLYLTMIMKEGSLIKSYKPILNLRGSEIWVLVALTFKRLDSAPVPHCLIRPRMGLKFE